MCKWSEHCVNIGDWHTEKGKTYMYLQPMVFTHHAIIRCPLNLNTNQIKYENVSQ